MCLKTSPLLSLLIWWCWSKYKSGNWSKVERERGICNTKIFLNILILPVPSLTSSVLDNIHLLGVAILNGAIWRFGRRLLRDMFGCPGHLLEIPGTQCSDEPRVRTWRPVLSYLHPWMNILFRCTQGVNYQIYWHTCCNCQSSMYISRLSRETGKGDNCQVQLLRETGKYVSCKYSKFTQWSYI